MNTSGNNWGQVGTRGGEETSGKLRQKGGVGSGGKGERNQRVKKGSGKGLGGACSLVSPFVSAMSSESQSGNEKFLRMEI